ncbi:MAG: CopG family transcriptional regulator [Candidatus Micrarchaeota archaeon]|nr:CopG family transcriptional regulator [Candidatus Micrarchaeota archaeon]
MEQMVTISVKIPKRLKEKISKSHLKVSSVVRSMLEERMIEGDVEKLQKYMKRHKKLLDKLTIGEAAKYVREDRDRR